MTLDFSFEGKNTWTLYTRTIYHIWAVSKDPCDSSIKKTSPIWSIQMNSWMVASFHCANVERSHHLPLFVWLAPRFQHHTHAAKVVQAFLFGSLEKELRAGLAWPQPTWVGLAKGYWTHHSILQGVVATRPFVQWSNQYFYPTYPCYHPVIPFPNFHVLKTMRKFCLESTQHLRPRTTCEGFEASK